MSFDYNRLAISNADTGPMRATRLRAVLGVLILVVCQGAPQANEASSQRVLVQLRDRQVVEPSDRRLVVTQGKNVEIQWRSDQAGELHLHGYDIAIKLRANEVVVTQFEAKASGRFPVTSHGFGDRAGHVHGHRALLYLEVHPD